MKKIIQLLVSIPILLTSCSNRQEDLEKCKIDTLIQKTDSAINQSNKIHFKIDSITTEVVRETHKRFNEIKKENELIKKKNSLKLFSKAKQIIVHDTIFIEK
jgi:hypothetical protein